MKDQNKEKILSAAEEALFTADFAKKNIERYLSLHGLKVGNDFTIHDRVAGFDMKLREEGVAGFDMKLREEGVAGFDMKLREEGVAGFDMKLRDENIAKFNMRISEETQAEVSNIVNLSVDLAAKKMKEFIESQK